ncbi:MAG: bifunctional phosphopantothenoylcysteine decarboxylase/phosphopantothenate--cysteine ligase CoaBC [candidate division Zixibacteria bacterium]|nr:bifunctional phosphopantothenoylcysteine decarboxylase/phosphopantothenate--cysteine ligase CoaBC [candidate division Zixibacteria bacterium]
MPSNLKNKKVLIGISGGIAAFKICELLRMLVKAGASVRVVMTESASKFVTPLTFSALGAESVSTSMWDPGRDSLEHVSWADWADLFVIAPATANIIAKMAAGIADEVLSTQLLAYDGPKLVAPAMNVKMWNNFATKRNIKTLKEQGIELVGPTKGHLASLIEAEGRMAEPTEVYKSIEKILQSKADLEKYRILVTAGPTVEPFDPVRFISNRSSGKMGYAIAEIAKDRGARVILVSGPVAITPPSGVELVNIETADQMLKAIEAKYKYIDVVIMTAAVADYKPKIYSRQKIKKTKSDQNMLMTKNPDIISTLAKRRGRKILVGFALETQNLKAAAQKKMLEKKLDMIVANNPTLKGVEFGSDCNKASIFVKGKRATDLPTMTKSDLAGKILDEVIKLLKRKKK